MNALIYALGGESEDIFASFTFDESADQKKYDPVKENFDHHFIAKKNVSTRGRNSTNADKVRTNQWTEFITDLYRLAEFCKYGSLRDEMIRDRLVLASGTINTARNCKYTQV